jgi:hypothetical protein
MLENKPLQVLNGGSSHASMAALMTCRLSKLGCVAQLRCSYLYTDVVVLEDFYNSKGNLIMKKDEFIRYEGTPIISRNQ